MKAFRVFLRRPLFRNYFSSLMRYALMKYGLIGSRDILIKCFDGAELHIDRNVFGLIIYLYVNNIVAGIDCLGHMVITVNGSLIPIDELSLVGWRMAVEALRRGWAYNSDGKYWFRKCEIQTYVLAHYRDF